MPSRRQYSDPIANAHFHASLTHIALMEFEMEEWINSQEILGELGCRWNLRRKGLKSKVESRRQSWATLASTPDPAWLHPPKAASKSSSFRFWTWFGHLNRPRDGLGLLAWQSTCPGTQATFWKNDKLLSQSVLGFSRLLGESHLEALDFPRCRI